MTPLVTIILTSHMKPTLEDALQSVLNQTLTDYECMVTDSGQWLNDKSELSMTMRRIHYSAIGFYPRINWFFTGEEPGLRDRLCPVAWATNETIRRNLVRGKYVCTFYDDDVYERTFLERMVGYLEDTGEQAVWCTQDRVRLLANDEHRPVGRISASHTLYPGMLDNRVDGGQVMFTRDALMRVGDPWLPEDPADQHCRHSDGVFLEKLCGVVGSINPLDEMLVTHRFTPYSTYSPS